MNDYIKERIEKLRAEELAYKYGYVKRADCSIDRDDELKGEESDFTYWGDRANENAHRMGYRDDERATGTDIALMHSELSEALEEFRHDRMELWFSKDKDGNDKPEGFYVELADCVLRILEFCSEYGEDLGEYIALKQEYNDTRNDKKVI